MHAVKWAFPEPTLPAALAISLDEVKDWLRVTSAAEDTLIQRLIRAATRTVQTTTDRALIRATYVLYLDEFPDEIRVPRSPLVSVTSIAYLDAVGASQTLDAADYRVDIRSEPGRITPAYGEVWPSTYPVTNAITLTYVAGYGTAASDVPEGLRQAVKYLVAHWYENREPVNVGNITTRLPFTVDALLAEYKVGWQW